MSQQDRLFQAFNMFGAGLQRLQTTRAINAANQQVQQLRVQELEDSERNQALSNIAQDLTLQLSSLGADSNQIKQAAGAIEPAQPQMIQSLHQGLFSQDPEQRERAIEYLDQEHQRRLELEGMRIQDRETRGSAVDQRHQDRMLQTQIRDFDRAPGVKEVKENLLQIQRQRGQLEEVRQRLAGKRPNDRAERASANLARAALARLISNQRLSNQMLDEAKLSQAWFNRARDQIKKIGSEEPLARDIEVAIQLFDQYKNALESSLDEQVDQFVESRQDLLPEGYDKETLGQRLRGIPTQPRSQQIEEPVTEGDVPPPGALGPRNRYIRRR